MVKFKDTDFLHVSTRIRSLEGKLLTERQLVQMIEAQTLEEAYKIVNDAGIGVGIAAEDYEQALEENMAETYAFLDGFDMGTGVLRLLRYEYDALNLKLLVKSQALDTDSSELLSDLGSVPAGELREQFRVQSFETLPAPLAAAVEEARDLLARTGDPQLVDICIDKAMLRSMREAAAKYDTPFLSKVIETKIDLANLRCVVRVRRMGRDPDFLKRVISPGGSINLDKLMDAFIKGMDGIAGLIESTRYGAVLEPALPALRSGGGLTEFERLCDNCLARLLGEMRLVPFGVEPLIVFAVAKETELKAARMVLASRKAGVEPGLIKERLRETYA